MIAVVGWGSWAITRWGELRRCRILGSGTRRLGTRWLDPPYKGCLVAWLLGQSISTLSRVLINSFCTLLYVVSVLRALIISITRLFSSHSNPPCSLLITTEGRSRSRHCNVCSASSGCEGCLFLALSLWIKLPYPPSLDKIRCHQNRKQCVGRRWKSMEANPILRYPEISYPLYPVSSFVSHRQGCVISTLYRVKFLRM